MPRLIPTLLFALLLAGIPEARAVTVAAAPGERPALALPADTPFAAVQQGGKSLSQAVDEVRRRGNVERIISAETRVSGGREVHHIKVLTRDGKVRTVTVQGRQRG